MWIIWPQKAHTHGEAVLLLAVSPTRKTSLTGKYLVGP